jgi:hypothetical protein
VTSASGSSATVDVTSSTEPSDVPLGTLTIHITSADQLEFAPRLLVCGPHAPPNACGA